MSIAEKIARLKKEKNAVILAHNYQRPEVQDVADFIGDSLALCFEAQKTDAKVIIFCGVDFMAESAVVLNPGKIIVHPEPNARCPMAAMVDVEGLRAEKKKHPDAAIVAYVNTSAAVKAESDICCTSANAAKVIESLPQKKVIFVPDCNLAMYVKRFVKGKEIIAWPGYCEVHQNRIQKESVLALKRLHPNAEVVAHPECTPDVIDVADFVFSTEGMIKHATASKAKEFIIATEEGICYRMGKMMPEKKFYAVQGAVCVNMKKITIEKVLATLEKLEPRVTLPADVAEKARKPLEKMMKIGRKD
ncbi:MAG: quinolinate synthase [Thermoplasmata archaeon HGW-Thermoplasmata-2]|nr:MAG: quinolinate synthase [Thermoplasmata archaeon HGW-Thermoplasmata-2]